MKQHYCPAEKTTIDYEGECNKKYKGILNECDIYVVRIGPNSLDNPLKYSRPCLDCESTIMKYNIKNVYYSTSCEYDIVHGAIHNKNKCKCFL